MKTLNQQLTLFPTEESLLLSNTTRNMKYTIEDLKKYAIEKKGKCLSNYYKRSDHKYLWKCENKLHKEFEAQWSNVNRKKRGQWCRDCFVESLKMDFTIIESQIEKFGGKLRTKKNEYINNKSPIIYYCEKGHECKSSWDRLQQASLKENGKKLRWCSKCSRRKEYTINEIRIIAKKRFGELLSITYNGNKDKLKWKCAAGHEFSLNLHNLLQGQWCKACNSSIGENLTRFYLGYILQVKFEKSLPEWLKINKTTLELDGYNEKSQVAFEYQGAQHKRYYPNHFHRNGIKDFYQQQTRDAFKREKCKEKQIDLIEIDDETTSREELYSVLYAKCSKLGLKIKKKDEPDINIFYSQFYQDKLIPILKIIKNYNGECLSDSYKGESTDLEFICQQGYLFKKTPTEIRKGKWCPGPCCNEKARDVNKVKTYIEEKGGVLLSEYRNNNSPIEFRCEKGHINITTWQSLRVSWCCKCSGNCKGTIDEMKEIAKSKGGCCLSTEYLGSHKKLEWICQKNNHKSWFATPNNIKPTSTKQGSWCPECWSEKKHNRQA
ncbi:MAG: zinc-ribbon domain-containing protein [Flavobacteriia bacterium]|nr:zinc-ribbon domain-containing protein [Flavobacteriia bacterium]